MTDARPSREEFFPTTLCHDCRWRRFVVSGRGSTFLYCRYFRRYPPQPVVACEGFAAAAGEEPVAGREAR